MRRVFQLERNLWSSWCGRLGRRPASPYERRARKAMGRSGRPVSLGRIVQTIKGSRFVVVGEDRLVPDDQEEILRLARRLSLGRGTLLVTDRFQASLQSQIDRFLSGEKSREQLLKRAGLEHRGPAFPEGGIGLVLEHARRRGWRVIACGRKESFVRADRRILQCVEGNRSEKGKILVWTGALRLSPGNLPRLFTARGLKGVFLALEAPEARWRSGRSKGWISLGPWMFAFVGRSPLLSLELYRAWSTKEGPLSRIENLEEDFRESLGRICDLARQAFPARPRAVFHPFDVRLFRYLGQSGTVRRTRRFLWERLHRGESAVLPKERIILLSTLNRGHIAEEAAHYARLAREPEQNFGSFRVALEEALAFMASTWIVPERGESPGAFEAASPWGTVHEAGYRLGKRLARRWRESGRHRNLLRSIWKARPGNEREARALLGLLRRIA